MKLRRRTDRTSIPRPNRNPGSSSSDGTFGSTPATRAITVGRCRPPSLAQLNTLSHHCPQVTLAASSAKDS